MFRIEQNRIPKPTIDTPKRSLAQSKQMKASEKKTP